MVQGASLIGAYVVALDRVVVALDEDAVRLEAIDDEARDLAVVGGELEPVRADPRPGAVDAYLEDLVAGELAERAPLWV